MSETKAGYSVDRIAELIDNAYQAGKAEGMRGTGMAGDRRPRIATAADHARRDAAFPNGRRLSVGSVAPAPERETDVRFPNAGRLR